MVSLHGRQGGGGPVFYHVESLPFALANPDGIFYTDIIHKESKLKGYF